MPKKRVNEQLKIVGSYRTDREIKEAAEAKAKKERRTLSSKIEEFLVSYANS